MTGGVFFKILKFPRMGFKVIIIKIFLTFGIIQAASYFDRIGIQGLNPKNDPIYDPETGKWKLDSSMDPVFEPEKEKVLYEQEPPISSNPASPLSIMISCDSSISLASPLSSIYSPSTFSEVSPKPSGKHHYDSFLYVPERCREYDRLWDFYAGYIENHSSAIGWISQLGYTKDLIRDLNLPKSNAVYTLIPSIYASKEELLPLLPSTQFLEITSEINFAFRNLFTLSVHLEKRIKKGIVIAVNLILFDDFARIIIIVDRSTENSGFAKVRRNLIPLFPMISDYTPYSIY